MRVAGVRNPTLECKTILSDTAKRITIDAPLVQGSFSLQGARIDDIVLTGYRETLDAVSENISFLRKASSQSSFFAEFGWAALMQVNPCQMRKHYGQLIVIFYRHRGR